MKLVQNHQAFTHGDDKGLFSSDEYPMNDADIDCALVKINGKYPSSGQWTKNQISKELLFCVEGGGILEMKSGERHEFKKNDAILIDAGEFYRFDANTTFCVVCTPPWTPEQCVCMD